MRFRCVDLFLLFERNSQNEQQSDRSERGECNESKHQDGHGSLLICILKPREREFGDGDHRTL